MNERIKQLALEAGKYADETQPLGSYTRNGMWLYAYNEKFAELIVRECMRKTAGYLFEDEFGDSDVKEASEELAKHFGVE